MQHNHVNMRLNNVNIIMLTCTMTYKIILSTYNIILFNVDMKSHMLSQSQVGDVCDIPITL